MKSGIFISICRNVCYYFALIHIFVFFLIKDMYKNKCNPIMNVNAAFRQTVIDLGQKMRTRI